MVWGDIGPNGPANGGYAGIVNLQREKINSSYNNKGQNVKRVCDFKVQIVAL